jgi:hypothetical protein
VHSTVTETSDRELVEQYVVGDAREALGQHQVLAGTAKRRVGAAVTRLDDERVAVVVPA